MGELGVTLKAERELVRSELRGINAALAILDAPVRKTWIKKAYTIILTLENWTGTGEDLRHLVVNQIGEPPNMNTWGGVIRGCLKYRFLANIGEWRPMRDASSHCRSTPVLTTTRRMG